MSKLKPAVSHTDHMQGSASAAIELVEYGDYECPHCGRAYPVIKRIQQAMGTNLKFIFRNFPLSEIHPHAVHAAVAAEAAGAQQKFWEMHDVIFENQNKLEDRNLLQHAQSIGIDVDKFAEDFDKEEYSEKVEADFESGVRSGVNGTPSFFVNGVKYDGDWAEKPLLAYLQSLL